MCLGDQRQTYHVLSQRRGTVATCTVALRQHVVVVCWSCCTNADATMTSPAVDVTSVTATGSGMAQSSATSRTTDTRQIHLQSAMYSCRSSRQTTMSCGSFIPLTLMTLSGLCESVLYRRIVEDPPQTTYIMLSRWVTPRTKTTTYNINMCYGGYTHGYMSYNCTSRCQLHYTALVVL